MHDEIRANAMRILVMRNLRWIQWGAAFLILFWAHIGSGQHGIQHVDCAKPVGMTGNGDPDRRCVAKRARDDQGSRDAISVEFLHPAVRKRFRSFGHIPAEAAGDVLHDTGR